MTGTGKTYWNGVDLTQSPYYAFLTSNTKYNWLEGLTFTQVPTGQNTMVSTSAYPSKMVLTLEYKLKPLANLGTLTGPSQTREELHAAWCALEALTDPILQGEGKLTLGEYPGSYWIAKRLQSTPTDEADYPAMADVQLEFAVTGMAYSVATSTEWATVKSPVTTFTVTSNGDALAYPCWNFYTGSPIVDSNVIITNETTNESVTWNGLMSPGDELQFIMDDEYGEPGTVVVNDTPQGNIKGPAWPHLVPGENVINVTIQGSGLGSSGPSGLIEVVWRDRFNRGQLTVPTPSSTAPVLPVLIYLKGADATGYGSGSSGSYVFYGNVTDIYGKLLTGVELELFWLWENPGPYPQFGPMQAVTTDSNGHFAFAATSPATQFDAARNVVIQASYAAHFAGDETHAPAWSPYVSAFPPASRLPTWLAISNVVNSGNNFTFGGFLGRDIAPASDYPISNEPIYLQVSNVSATAPNSSWAMAPHVPQSTWEAANPFEVGCYTDSDGVFNIYYTVGPSTTQVPNFYFRVWYPGDLVYNGAVSVNSSGANTAITVNQPENWPAATPGEINYIVAMPVAMVSGLTTYPGVPYNNGQYVTQGHTFTGGQMNCYPNLPSAGQLQYFASLGFNSCYLIAPDEDNQINESAWNVTGIDGNPNIHVEGTYDTWDWEYNYIKSLGMTPVIDVCHSICGGGYWYDQSALYSSIDASTGQPTGPRYGGCFEMYRGYLEALVAAGWEYVANETGLAQNTGTDPSYSPGPYDNWIDFCISCGFKGVVNYNGGGDGLWAWPPDSDNFNDYWMNISASWIGQHATILNNCEYYYTQVPNLVHPNEGMSTMTDTDAIEEIALAGQQVGIPTGILAGVWPDAPLQGVDNEAYDNTRTGFGATYSSLLAWSYDNGCPITTFGVWFQPNSSSLLMNYYNSLGFHDIVVGLIQEYPPLNPPPSPPQRMPNLTLNSTEESGEFTFFGQLTDLITGNPIADASVYLQWTPCILKDNAQMDYGAVPLNGFVWNNTNSGGSWTGPATGAAPATTDSNGNWTSSAIDLPAGTYDFRIWFPGNSTYLPTFYPYSIYGFSVLNGSSGTTPTTLSLSASTLTPKVNQSYTLTATLETGSTPISGQTINFYTRPGATLVYSGTTNSSGVVTTSTFSSTSTQEIPYFASYDGTTTYVPATSPEVDVTVVALSSTLTLTASPTTTDTGTTVNLTATLTSNSLPVTNMPVTITYYFGGSEYTDVNSPVTTDQNGNATFSESFPTAGVYTYYAAFAGSGVYPAATSSALDLTVLTPTAISLSSTNQNPNPGQPFTLTATLTNELTNALITSESGVSIYHYAPGSTTPVFDLTDGTTDLALGTVTCSASCPSSGAYEYYATLALDDTNFYDTSTSAALPITIFTNTALTLTPSSTSITSAQTLTLTAVLETAVETGVVGQAFISGETVQICQTLSSTTTQLYSATTNADGEIEFEGELAIGTYTFWATFAGDPTNGYNASTSYTVSVTVTQAVTYLSYEGVTGVNTSTGNETFTVGFEPIAVLFWWTAQTGTGSWSPDAQAGFGFAANTGTVGEGYISNAIQNTISTTSVAGRKFNSGAAIGLAQPSGSNLGEATITFTSTGFTLDWTTAPYGAFALYYLALGGTGYTNAAVVSWTASTSAGTQTVTNSLGFTPGCVITIGNADPNASPDSYTDAYFMMGALDASGNQWSKNEYVRNGQSTTSAHGIQLTTSHIVGLSEATASIDWQATGAIITDGFTVDWLSGQTAPNAMHFMSLCLGGGNYEVGSWNKSTTVAPPTVTTTINLTNTSPPTPVAVFTTNRCAVASTSSGAGYRLSLGASAIGSPGSTALGAVLCTSKNGVVLSSGSATDTYKYNNPYNNLIVAASDTEGYDAIGYAGGFALGSFSNTWTANNSVATQICYIAIGY